MQIQPISATDLRIRLHDIIERARFKGEHFVVHTFGKPVVIILGIDEYNALIKSATTLPPPAITEPVLKHEFAPPP